MAKAFCYLRVSGLGQVDGYGFERQEEACRAYCLEHGLEVAGVFREEGVSGTTSEADRPALQEMLTAILANGVRVVVVESMDRLARELRVQEALLVYLASKEITLISARTGEDVTAAVTGDPLRKALVQVQGVFSELEKAQLVRRLAKGREKAREARGRCEGRKPYGDTPEEQAVIRRVRALRRRGRDGHPRHTLQEIAALLNQEGVKAKAGGAWGPAQVARLLKA